jgi:hypothetical protein
MKSEPGSSKPVNPDEESLGFHAAAPQGGEGYVMLLERMQPEALITVRRWDAPDYTAAPREERRSVAELRSQILREAKAGWHFTVPVERILFWLEARVGRTVGGPATDSQS